MSRYDKYDKYCKSFFDFSKMRPLSDYTQEELEELNKDFEKKCELGDEQHEKLKKLIKEGKIAGIIHADGTISLEPEHDTTIEDMLKGQQNE